MDTFHETTSTILKYILAEQRRDLMLTEQRLEKADESTLKTDVERERFSRTVAKFRDQIAELTAVVADFERLVQYVKDENAEAVELEQARAEVAASAERHHGTWGPNGEDYIPEDGPEVHELPLLDGVYDESETGRSVGLGSVWADPAVRRAVRETIAEGGS